MWNATANDGTRPYIGIDWWEWPDKVSGGENTNFGWVSQRDNPYGLGLDTNGNNCTETQGAVMINDCTELATHGDFITSAVTENVKLMNALINLLPPPQAAPVKAGILLMANQKSTSPGVGRGVGSLP